MQSNNSLPFCCFWAQFHQRSKYSFCAQIPKEYKDTDDLTVFITPLGSTSIKAAHKRLVKLTPDGVSVSATSAFASD